MGTGLVLIGILRREPGDGVPRKLWRFASPLPEPGRVFCKVLVSVFPSMMLGHVLLAECLAAVFTGVVGWEVVTAFRALCQGNDTHQFWGISRFKPVVEPGCLGLSGRPIGVSIGATI